MCIIAAAEATAGGECQQLDTNAWCGGSAGDVRCGVLSAATQERGAQTCLLGRGQLTAVLQAFLSAEGLPAGRGSQGRSLPFAVRAHDPTAAMQADLHSGYDPVRAVARRLGSPGHRSMLPLPLRIRTSCAAL